MEKPGQNGQGGDHKTGPHEPPTVVRQDTHSRERQEREDEKGPQETEEQDDPRGVLVVDDMLSNLMLLRERHQLVDTPVPPVEYERSDFVHSTTLVPVVTFQFWGSAFGADFLTTVSKAFLCILNNMSLMNERICMDNTVSE